MTEPRKRQSRLSLPLLKFHFDFAFDDDRLKDFCTKNTIVNNEWLLKNFFYWVIARNKNIYVDYKCTSLEILSPDNASELCELLGLFVKQMHKANGEEYTPECFKSFHNVCKHEFC